MNCESLLQLRGVRKVYILLFDSLDVCLMFVKTRDNELEKRYGSMVFTKGVEKRFVLNETTNL